MHIKINLLPNERKKGLIRKKVLKFVIWQEVLIIFSLIIFLAMLLSINLILRIGLKNAEEENSRYAGRPEFQEMKKYEDDFAKINKKVEAIESVQKNDFYWTNFFYELSRLTPGGVKIFNINTNQTTILVSGRSSTRDDLILLEDNLKKSPCFSEVTIPLSDIVKKENIDFSVELKIKKECIKTK